MNKHENKKTENINNQNDMSATANAESQLGLLLTKFLDENAQQVNQNVANRLASARNLAVNQLAEHQSNLAAQHIIIQSGNKLQWSNGNLGHYFAQHRLIMIGIIVTAILFTFFVTQQFDFNNLERSDAFLLASDLPPEAYADQGFDAWLDTEAN